MKSRKSRVTGLMRRIGPMRTLLLTSLIDDLPFCYVGSDWFTPRHTRIMKQLNKLHPAVYWQLMNDLIEIGVVEKRKGKTASEFKVNFEAIETRLQWSRLEGLSVAIGGRIRKLLRYASRVVARLKARK